ncbi:MAG: signal peptidase I [Adlercreutzia sp.]|nr:signal peptidase I [Adlercreutzia sp.]
MMAQVNNAATAETLDGAQDKFSREVDERLAHLRSISRVCSVIGVILLSAVVALALSATILPRIMGLQAYAIVSGSMEPNLPVGSLVYAEPYAPESLAPGEVAVFWRKGDVIVHRVEENRTEKQDLITRGDANDGIDAHPAQYEDVVGRVVSDIPYIGYFIMALASLPGKFVLGWVVLMGAAFAIIGTYIANLARR